MKEVPFGVFYFYMLKKKNSRNVALQIYVLWFLKYVLEVKTLRGFSRMKILAGRCRWAAVYFGLSERWLGNVEKGKTLFHNETGGRGEGGHINTSRIHSLTAVKLNSEQILIWLACE